MFVIQLENIFKTKIENEISVLARHPEGLPKKKEIESFAPHDEKVIELLPNQWPAVM